MRPADAACAKAPICLLVGLLLLPLAGCKGQKRRRKRPRDGCSAQRLKETRRWLAELCAAHAGKLESPGAHWWGLPLARADVKLVRRLPRGVLITLTTQRLRIDGKPAPDWPKPAHWSPPDLSRGVGPVLGRLVPKLRKTLGASAAVPAARAALEDLRARSIPRVDGQKPHLGAPRRARPDDLPSGLTVLTLVTAKRQLPGREPRLAHLAIGPRVSLQRVVQLQTLVALAGFDGVHLLFTPRSAPDAPSPPAPRLLAALGTIGPAGDSRARHAARRKVLYRHEQHWIDKGCAAMTQLRAALRKTPPAKRCALLRDRLPDTFRRCKCTLDERPLLTLWRAVLGPFDHVGTWSGQLHPRSRPLNARATAVWSELADRLVQQKRKHLWIALE